MEIKTCGDCRFYKIKDEKEGDCLTFKINVMQDMEKCSYGKPKLDYSKVCEKIGCTRIDNNCPGNINCHIIQKVIKNE